MFNRVAVEAMMKTLLWKFCLAAALFSLMEFGTTAVAVAADNPDAGPADRLQRLERRVNELAERQEQIIRQMGVLQERPGRLMPRWRMLQERPGTLPPPNLENARPPLAGFRAPAPVMAKRHPGLGGLVCLAVLAGLFCNVLLAVWIFTDIRKRGEGSGIFIALALVAGIPTAIIYALVRIGDRKA